MKLNDKVAELKGAELFKFLTDNKKALITEKKSMPIKFSDPLISGAKIANVTKSGVVVKDDMESPDDPTNSEVLRVTVVANSCNIMDSHSDVLITNSAKRTIQQRKGMFVHLSNHDYRIQAKVGEVVDVMLKNYQWRDLGVDVDGATQCIVFVTDVYKSYDESIFNQYKNGKINQHSIGLRYVDIELAINDSGYEKEQEFWNKYIDEVVNREEAEAQGYFWVVKEIQLLENSSVLFGSNYATPTISMTEQQKHSAPATPEQAPAPEAIVKFGFGSLSKLLN